jgi:hypothetical protein
VVRDRDDAAPGLERVYRIGQRLLEGAQLAVDFDADGLERPARRMGAGPARRRGDRVLDDHGERGRPGYRPGGDDRRGDARRESFLPERPDDAGEGALRISVHDGVGRERLSRVHPHVERPVGAEAEAAIRLIQLG